MGGFGGVERDQLGHLGADLAGTVDQDGFRVGGTTGGPLAGPDCPAEQPSGGHRQQCGEGDGHQQPDRTLRATQQEGDAHADHDQGGDHRQGQRLIQRTELVAGLIDPQDPTEHQVDHHTGQGEGSRYGPLIGGEGEVVASPPMASSAAASQLPMSHTIRKAGRTRNG